MKTFKDLLRLVATHPGRYEFRYGASEGMIGSDRNKPEGLVFCGSKPILRFRFKDGKAEFRLPGWFTPWNRFELDESLNKLGPMFHVGIVDMLIAAIDHSSPEEVSDA